MMCGGGSFTAEAKCKVKKKNLFIVSSIVIKPRLNVDPVYEPGY